MRALDPAIADRPAARHVRTCKAPTLRRRDGRRPCPCSRRSNAAMIFVACAPRRARGRPRCTAELSWISGCASQPISPPRGAFAREAFRVGRVVRYPSRCRGRKNKGARAAPPIHQPRQIAVSPCAIFAHVFWARSLVPSRSREAGFPLRFPPRAVAR